MSQEIATEHANCCGN